MSKSPFDGLFDHYIQHVHDYHEHWRHECEARHLLKMILDGRRAEVIDFLNGKHVAKRRDKLRATINQLLGEMKHERKSNGRKVIPGTRENAAVAARENLRRKQ